MAILVLDTATEALAVAIGNEGDVVAGSVFRVPRGHSRILQPAISHLLSQTGVGMDDITGIAVGIGPGSYTGVRLAVSTAKAMAVTLRVPLYPVPTLFGIAGAAVPGRPIRPSIVLPMLFARRGRAYGAMYLKKQDGSIERLKSSTVMSVQDWCEAATDKQREVCADLVVVHDFLPKHGVLELLGSLENACVMKLSVIAPQLCSSFVHLVSSGLVSEVVGEDVHEVVPEYALEVEAEVKLRDKLRDKLREMHQEGRLGANE